MNGREPGQADPYARLLIFIERLREANIHYRVDCHRSEAVMVEIAVPGERWEVEFLRDGEVDVEIFKSDGHMFEEEKLRDLFELYSD